MVFSVLCCKLTLLWAVILSCNIVVVTPFHISHSSRIHQPLFKANLAASTSPGDSSDIVTPPTATPATKSQRSSTEKILDQALCSNSTAAKLLLDEISELRNDGKEEELDLLLSQLLCLADGVATEDSDPTSGNGLPWWTRVRILGRFSRRARRASLHRVLNLSTPSAEDGVEGNDSNSKSRRRRRALVLILRSLATSSDADEGLDDQEEDVLSPSKGGSRIAIRNIERAARKDMKNTASYRDMSSRVPPGLETPKFTVIVQRKGYDVRDYEAFSICSVSVAKPRPDSATTDQPISNPQLSGASSFGALAGYLFGKNDESTSMKMTTPVLMEGAGEDRQMSFVLPSTYWDEKGLENAPKPLQGSLVSLERDTGGNRAVLMFGGFASKDDVKAKTADLLKGLEYDKEWGAVEDASVTLAQYNDPFTPPWKRRNEVSVPVVARKEE
mmetsp:Transcript_24370/g.28719  ORF Transcript_24370/g.28719 Transcript_24370/m.28719 type:complete len:444 (-) Transcript_24370:58-1389(-)